MRCVYTLTRIELIGVCSWNVERVRRDDLMSGLLIYRERDACDEKRRLR
jgi:hypothetical protein